MSKRIRRQEEAFQMAPMIDMVFLLLVFFMTVSTLAREARPETDLAYSETATVPEAASPRAVMTILKKQDVYQLFWYNRAVSTEELAELLDANDGREVVVRAPGDLPWSAFRSILEPLRKSGISDATFATFEQ